VGRHEPAVPRARAVVDIPRQCVMLVAHCCEAWNKLTDQPWKIMSIGLRQWAHGF
jgi:hypothetical protein